MTTSMTSAGRRLGLGAFRALGLPLRILYTTALVLLFAGAIGAVVGLALAEALDQVIAFF